MLLSFLFSVAALVGLQLLHPFFVAAVSVFLAAVSVFLAAVLIFPAAVLVITAPEPRAQGKKRPKAQGEPRDGPGRRGAQGNGELRADEKPRSEIGAMNIVTAILGRCPAKRLSN